MVYTLHFFSSKCSLFHNSNMFASCIIHILYTGCAKIKKNNSSAKRLTFWPFWIHKTWRQNSFTSLYPVFWTVRFYSQLTKTLVLQQEFFFRKCFPIWHSTNSIIIIIIIVIIYLSWSWATFWPVPVSHIQKSLQWFLRPGGSNIN